MVDIYTPQLYIPGGGSGAPRSGIVQRNDRAVFDDGGSFYPCGMTMMWSDQGIYYEWDHYAANVEWMAGKRFDFKRPLEEVGWDGNRRLDPTQPPWTGGVWQDVIRRDLDFSYDLGIRSGITLSGKGTATDLQWLAREVCSILNDGRLHKALCIEMQNEYSNGGSPLQTLIDMARTCQGLVPLMLGLSTPGNEQEVEQIRKACADLRLALFIRHTDRAQRDFGWGQVRQSYDFHEDKNVGADWEGPGPGSSVATLTSPLQLAVKRLLAAICGAPIFVLHTGTGVYGDGKPASTGPRPPNFWEIPNIDNICAAVRGVDILLPAEGMPNWVVANTQWVPPNPVAPFQPHHHWEGPNAPGNDGVNKAYSALAPDGRVIQIPSGVRKHALMTASYPLKEVSVFQLTETSVIDLASIQPMPGFQNLSFAQGQSMDLPGEDTNEAMVAYVIHGRRA